MWNSFCAWLKSIFFGEPVKLQQVQNPHAPVPNPVSNIPDQKKVPKLTLTGAGEIATTEVDDDIDQVDEEVVEEANVRTVFAKNYAVVTDCGDSYLIEVQKKSDPDEEPGGFGFAIGKSQIDRKHAVDKALATLKQFDSHTSEVRWWGSVRRLLDRIEKGTETKLDGWVPLQD